MSEQQDRRLHGTIIRGADGELYFIPDAVMAPYRIEEQGRDRASTLLQQEDDTGRVSARHVSLPPESLGRINQISEDISLGRHHEPVAAPMGRHNEDADDVDPSLGRHNENTDDIESSLGRHNENTDDIDPSLGRHNENTDDIDPSLGRINQKPED